MGVYSHIKCDGDQGHMDSITDYPEEEASMETSCDRG